MEQLLCADAAHAYRSARLLHGVRYLLGPRADLRCKCPPKLAVDSLLNHHHQTIEASMGWGQNPTNGSVVHLEHLTTDALNGVLVLVSGHCRAPAQECSQSTGVQEGSATASCWLRF
eukprot:1702305-Rhodomonas_salina.2